MNTAPPLGPAGASGPSPAPTPMVIDVDVSAAAPGTPAVAPVPTPPPAPQLSGQSPRTPQKPPTRPVINVDESDERERKREAVANDVVLKYLRQQKYNSAASELLRESMGLSRGQGNRARSLEMDPDLRNSVMMLTRPGDLSENEARRYGDCYCELRDWVDSSLDIYKAELRAVLYPLFVHSFLEMVRLERWLDARAFLNRCSRDFEEDGTVGRSKEIKALAGIASLQHLEENRVAKLFLDNRYEVHLTKYAYELLLHFLSEDTRRHVLMRILNMRCSVQIAEEVEIAARFASGAVAIEEDTATDKQGFIPTSEQANLLRHEVLWGRLRPEQYLIPDEDEPAAGKKAAAKGVAAKGAAAPADKSKAAAPDAKAKGEAGKKDAQGGGEDDEEPMTQEDGTINKSKIPLKKYRMGAAGLETAADRRNRARVSVEAAAHGLRSTVSVLCYTFTNTREDGLNCSSVCNDGSLVAAGFSDSTVRLWDAKASGTAGSGAGGLGGKPVKLVGHSGPVYDVTWTRCSRYVLSGSEDGTVRLWNVGLKVDVAAYRGHNYPVWSVAMAPLGQYFASGSHDRTARMWSTDNTTPLRIFAGHLSDVDVVRWHPNCNYVATGSSDRTARLWDVREGRCVRVFGTQGGTVHALAFSPDGRTVACGGDGRAIEVWDLAMGRRVQRLYGHRGTVWSLDYSREGAVLASGGADCAVCTWDAQDWSRVVEPEPEELANGNGNGGKAEEGDAAGGGGDGGSGPVSVSVSVAGAANGAGPGGGKDGKDGAGADGEDGDGKVGDGGAAAAKDEGDAAAAAAVTGLGAKRKRRKADESALLERLETKATPIHTVRFTRRNVLIATGHFVS